MTAVFEDRALCSFLRRTRHWKTFGSPCRSRWRHNGMPVANIVKFGFVAKAGFYRIRRPAFEQASRADVDAKSRRSNGSSQVLALSSTSPESLSMGPHNTDGSMDGMLLAYLAPPLACLTSSEASAGRARGNPVGVLLLPGVGELRQVRRLTEPLIGAHRTVLFGTSLRVTILKTGKHVSFASIRGPYARGRVIDVSRRAAENLGMAGAGLARVKVEIVQWRARGLIFAASPLQRSPSCATGGFLLAELLFKVFSQRYERGSTIVTSNHAQRRLPHGFTERLHRETNDQKRHQKLGDDARSRPPAK